VDRRLQLKDPRPYRTPSCDHLLTLDRADFAGLLQTSVYGTCVFTPADFLIRLRAAGKL
jgi:hypothetical protein